MENRNESVGSTEGGKVILDAVPISIIALTHYVVSSWQHFSHPTIYSFVWVVKKV